MSGPVILCYHAVSERWPATLAVTPTQLEDHVGLLARRGYRGVTFHEAISAPSGDRVVAITFDDACHSVLELAGPILANRAFVATVFAPTSFVGAREAMSWPGVEHWLDTEHAGELVPMSWPELDRLAAQGWEIGSHTRTHPRLTALASSALESELRGSREQIEDMLGRPCRSLAYPYGEYDERVIEAARRAGYSGAAGTARYGLRPPTGGLDWPRIVVNRVDRRRRFRLKLSPAIRRLRAGQA